MVGYLNFTIEYKHILKKEKEMPLRHYSNHLSKADNDDEANDDDDDDDYYRYCDVMWLIKHIIYENI